MSGSATFCAGERERRCDDIQHIADYLRIRKGFLVAIEESHYEEFPADIYVIGFLRSYAQYLDLNGQEVVDYYRHEMEGRRKQPTLIVPKPISEGKAPSAVILVGAAIVALLIYVVWYSFSTSDRAAVNMSPTLPPTVGESAKPVTVPSPIVTAAPLPETVVIPPPAASAQTPAATSAPEQLVTAPVASAATSRITIKAEQASWVQVSDHKDHVIFDSILKPGETYNVPDAPGMSLTTGNGAGLVISIDGKDLPKLVPSASKMLRDVPLTPTALKKLSISAKE